MHAEIIFYEATRMLFQHMHEYCTMGPWYETFFWQVLRRLMNDHIAHSLTASL